MKGRDSEVGLEVRVLRPDGSPDPGSPQPVLRANVGLIDGVERVGPGVFRARYRLPKTRYPEVAVIVAFAPWPHPDAIHGAFGSLLVPLASSIDLPGYSEPGAEMSIEIGGVTYGPTTVSNQGRFQLPVVVPPGHRYGKGIAVDRAGNRRVTRIDLMLPPTDQLACVMNPRRLPADGAARGRVICATTDPHGRPQASAKVRLTASAGTLSSARTVGKGVFEWIYTAPEALQAGPVSLEAEWRQGRARSREAFELELVQGPVASVSLEAQEPIVHYGGRVSFVARAFDAQGRARSGVKVLPSVPAGSASEVTESAPGEYRFSWSPPPDGDEDRARISVRAFGPFGASPARIVTWREGGDLWAGVVDLAGWPVPGQPLRVDGRSITTSDDGAVSLGVPAAGQHRIEHAQWPGLSVTVDARPGTAVAQVELALAPPVPVTVRIAVEGRQVTYWAETPTGEPVEGRRLSLSVQGAEVSQTRSVGGRTTVVLGGRAAANVSVADVESGVTALATVP
ncbi:MAG: hypothetical protein WBV82_07520 [Myxococcaceae bacterium]